MGASRFELPVHVWKDVPLQERYGDSACLQNLAGSSAQCAPQTVQSPARHWCMCHDHKQLELWQMQNKYLDLGTHRDTPYKYLVRLVTVT